MQEKTVLAAFAPGAGMALSWGRAASSVLGLHPDDVAFIDEQGVIAAFLIRRVHQDDKGGIFPGEEVGQAFPDVDVGFPPQDRPIKGFDDHGAIGRLVLTALAHQRPPEVG